MLKLKRLYEGRYKIEGHSRDYQIEIYRSCDDQKLGVAMDIHSRACQMQKNLCSQSLERKHYEITDRT